jgi:hypothetical protein
MKRDMDLCRKILQHVEGLSVGVRTIDVDDLEYAVPDIDQDTVNYHVRLLMGAGFIESTGTSVRGALLVKGLTWGGYEFLEKSRDEGLWGKAKKIAKEKTGGLAVESLSAILSDLIKNAIGG